MENRFLLDGGGGLLVWFTGPLWLGCENGKKGKAKVCRLRLIYMIQHTVRSICIKARQKGGVVMSILDGNKQEYPIYLLIHRKSY